MSVTKELSEYRTFTLPAELEKAVNTLKGILEGVRYDGVIDQKETTEILNWCSLHKHLENKHPFNEIFQIIYGAYEDSIFTQDEIEDILWVCDRITLKTDYYDFITANIQQLHGILHGILANNCLIDEEIKSLSEWLSDNDFLAGTYPFDEINSLVTSVLKDGKITEDERNMLKAFFSYFIDTKESYNLNDNELNELRNRYNIKGICAVCPNIIINNKTFCFTGASKRASRNEIADFITQKGGIYNNNVTQSTDYLIVGNEGNPCWAYSCYGRKVEQAVKLRQKGFPIIIVNELDFWDSISD